MFWYISIIHKIWELNEMIKVKDKIRGNISEQLLRY